MAATRPNSIIWFERLYIGSLMIAAAVMAMGWDAVRTDAIPPGVLIAGVSLGLLLPLLLILLVSRKRSRVAKWLLVALFAIGLASIAMTWDRGRNWRLDIIGTVTTAMQLLAVALLFTGPARAWLAGKDEPGPGPIFE